MKEKKIVYNNKVIAVGGMIALGKTTLIEGLNKRYKNSIAVYELSEENKVQDLLLEGLYKKTVTIDLLQLYFLNNRLKNYIETVKKNEDKDYILFDRTTFEDPLFAKKLFKNSEQLKYYNEMWELAIKELCYITGLPKIYIVLDGSFETFEKRIFERSRKAEIENYENNKEYFKDLLDSYPEHMKDICKHFGVRLEIINVDNKTKEQVLEEVIKKIEE